MATLFVDKLDPQSGTALEIGTSGDTITVPSGATLNVAGTITNSGTATGFGGTNTPAFEAYLGSNTGFLTNNSYVKVQCNTEVYDTDSAYDNSTNYRFTPQTAGKYYVYGAVGTNSNGDDRLRNSYATIYKNGSQYRDATFNHSGNPGRTDTVFVSAILDMNGSSDYVELYGAVNDNSGSNQGYFLATDKITYFGAYKIIT